MDLPHSPYTTAQYPAAQMLQDSAAVLPETDSLPHAPPASRGGRPEPRAMADTVTCSGRSHFTVNASRPLPSALDMGLSAVFPLSYSDMASFSSFRGPKYLAIKEFWRKCYMTIFSLTVSSQALTSSGYTTFGTKPQTCMKQDQRISWKAKGEVSSFNQ